MMDICVFGASGAYGAFDVKGGGWVSRLRKYIEENAKPLLYMNLVYNCGVSGDTTMDLLKRFKIECRARSKGARYYGDDFAIVFDVGKNDSVLDRKNQIPVPLSVFKRNLRRLVREARGFTTNIFCMSILPVDETKSAPRVGNKNLSYKNNRISNYNTAINEVCTDLRVSVIDVHAAFKRMDYKRLLEDGLHPNSIGHKKIFNTVKDYLSKNGVI
jgi:lysophospholipase L1-like esterase